MQDYSLMHPLTALALAYIAKDVVPWVGVQLIAVGKWFAPQAERIVDALVARIQSPTTSKEASKDTTPPTVKAEANASTEPPKA